MSCWKRRLGFVVVASMMSAPLLAGKHDHDHHGHEKHDHDDHGHEQRGHGAHVHGLAKLTMAIEGKQVLIEFETPAANVVGFEHAPQNSEQKKKVAKAVKTLQDYRNLVALKDGDCVQKNADVESPFHEDEHEQHKHDEHDHHKKGEKEESHSDFELGYELACKSAKAIKSAEVTAFKNFPGFEKIKVEWVGESGQGAQEATKERAIVNLK